MSDLREAAEMALDALDIYREHNEENIGLADAAYEALRQALAQPEQEREWVELDVNEVIEVIHKNIPNPTPELLDKLYGLVADIDLWLQEKNGVGK